MNKTKKTIMKGAVIFGIIILPLIYSITYLKGFWDPYNNLGDMKVAIVNNDKCDSNCKSDILIDKLKDSDSFNFIVKDSKTAEEGLHDKKYYAVITIPSDFTSSFENADKKDRSSATITYRPNNKTNYIASQLINNALLQVEMKLDSEVSKEVVGGLSTKLEEIPSLTDRLSNGFSNLANGTSLLDNGVSTLKEGTSTLNSNYRAFDNGVNDLNNVIKESTDGINTINDKSGQIREGINTISQSMNTLREGTEELSNNYQAFDVGLGKLKEGTTQLKEGTQGLNSLKEGVLSLQQGSNDLNNGLTTYKASSDKAYDDANSVYSFLVNYLDDYFVQNPDAQNDPQFALVYQIANGYITKDASGLSGLDKLKMSNSGLLSGATNLNNGVNLLASHISSLDGLLDAIDNLDQGASSLKENSTLINLGIQKINSGVNGLQVGINTLNTNYILFDGGINKLASASMMISNGAQKLTDSSSLINNGINTLDTSIFSLKAGTSKLDNSVNVAKEELDVKSTELNQKLDDLDGLDEYVEKPVIVKTDGYGDVNDYGTFFSPFFMSLSFWIGGLLILIGLYYDPDNRFEILGRHSKNRPLRLVYYVLIGIIQAFVLGTVLKVALGFEVTNLLLFYGSCILISLAFLSIMMFLFFNLGDVGKFIAIVWLVVQLAACGGTFPLEVEPNFFRIISPFMPMTYSVELLRESFVSIEHSLLIKDVIVLTCILIGCSALVFGFGYIKTKKQGKKKKK